MTEMAHNNPLGRPVDKVTGSVAKGMTGTEACAAPTLMQAFHWLYHPRGQFGRIIATNRLYTVVVR